MATTLADLRDGAKNLSDKSADDQVSDATWGTWVNQGIEALYRLITSANPDAFYTTADFTLAGGISGNAYSLPAAFRTLLGLTLDPTTSGRRNVPKFNFAERNDYTGPYPWSWGWGTYPTCRQRRYRVLARTITVEPYEFAAGNYRAHYRQGPTKLVADGDTLDVVLEPFAEYVMCFAARKGLAVEESDTSEVTTRMRELEVDIANTAQADLQPDTISDTAGW
jgi:hypothetical protein